MIGDFDRCGRLGVRELLCQPDHERIALLRSERPRHAECPGPVPQIDHEVLFRHRRDGVVQHRRNELQVVRRLLANRVERDATHPPPPLGVVAVAHRERHFERVGVEALDHEGTQLGGLPRALQEAGVVVGHDEALPDDRLDPLYVGIDLCRITRVGLPKEKRCDRKVGFSPRRRRKGPLDPLVVQTHRQQQQRKRDEETGDRPDGESAPHQPSGDDQIEATTRNIPAGRVRIASANAVDPAASQLACRSRRPAMTAPNPNMRQLV